MQPATGAVPLASTVAITITREEAAKTPTHLVQHLGHLLLYVLL